MRSRHSRSRCVHARRRAASRAAHHAPDVVPLAHRGGASGGSTRTSSLPGGAGWNACCDLFVSLLKLVTLASACYLRTACPATPTLRPSFESPALAPATALATRDRAHAISL